MRNIMKNLTENAPHQEHHYLHQRSWKRRRPSSTMTSTLTRHRLGRLISLTLALVTLLAILPISDGAKDEDTTSNFKTYNNDPRDLSEPATRHVKTQRKNRVSMDDLKLGEMEAKEAAQQVMNRITLKVCYYNFL